MRCYCCSNDMPLARKVKLRPWRQFDPRHGVNPLAYHSYCQDMAYRWAVLCQACYGRLDNAMGLAEVGGRLFNLAGASRGDKAAVLDEAKYQAFQRREARKLGLEL